MLQHLLGRPQRGVSAALLQQRLVRAVLNDIAALQHVNFIRRCDVRQTVRDQQHRLPARQCVNLRHDVVLALNVDVRRSLVEDVHRTVVQQRAGERKALALTARKVLAALGK